MSSGAFLLLLLVGSSTAVTLKKTDGGLSRMKRTASHVIKECIHMTSEEGHYYYKSAGDDATVCGIYFVTAPNMLVQVHFDYLDVPCATGGLLAFVDGWELNGGYFPGVEDHELPLSERVSEFCGLTPPTRTFLSSQNAALLQYRKQIASKAGTSTPHKPVDWFWTADSFLHDVIRLGFSEPKDISAEYRYLKAQYEPTAMNSSATEAEIYFGSDMPVSSTVEVIEEPASYVEEELMEDQQVKQVNVKTEVVEETRLGDNSIYLELDDEQLMAIENGEMSIEDVTARAEAAASQHQQQVARDRSMKAERMSLKESIRTDEEEEDRSRTNEEEEVEDEFDAFGRCVALQLKTLPIDAALELESQIHTLITKKRMILLRKNKLH